MVLASRGSPRGPPHRTGFHLGKQAPWVEFDSITGSECQVSVTPAPLRLATSFQEPPRSWALGAGKATQAAYLSVLGYLVNP